MVWWMTGWMAGPGNLPLWQRLFALDQSLGQRVGSILGLALLIAGITATLLCLLNWPRLLRPLASVMLIITAFSAHYMWQYGVVIDPTMLANALHTDVREVRDLLSPSLAISLGFLAAPPLWWLWRRPLTYRPAGPQLARNVGGAALGLLLALVVVLVSYQGLATLMRNDKSLRYMVSPLNAVYAAGVVAAEQGPRKIRALQPVGEDARLGASYFQQTRPPLLVLVVGETARADRFGLNGYGRDTTPLLTRWRDAGDLLNFDQVSSCGTNTLVSVPCLFSPLTRGTGGNAEPDRENLLDVLQRAGLAVLWLDNQSGCKGVCDRVPHASTRDAPMPVPGASLCEGSDCFDEALLAGLDDRLAALDPQRLQRGAVVVLHQMGSHGPAYFRRAPQARKRFQPECASTTLSDCTSEQLDNAYDNSIAYTDQFLDQVLHWVEKKSVQGTHDSGLIYVSDHGESLGERGLYLHGVPYALAPAQQTHVPMVTWLSPGLQQRTGVAMPCLRARVHTPISHDHFFHSVLGLMDVNTNAYQPGLDAMAPCATQRVQAAGFKPSSAG
ncbi:phosphoethanolamine transferase [Hydrogenophaga sp.]|uniref:phosphoethanolamine transferase n=1 Tax=Hydrogenophaga sp. TaxID=1904254 RepID=UPI002715F689|nr:phosphoethanolamine--lipid A transferase [Hydrogenophaga sp.]MDO8906212.1 phosphoethanolamine--lipid A transferase [Hydrogenophaga sp.]